MELIWAVYELIAPSVCAKGYIDNFDIGIGISFGDILCSKVGIRGEDNNDLMWTSTTTNLAAKMGNQASNPFNIIIDSRVWESIPNNLKFKETRLIHHRQYEGFTPLNPKKLTSFNSGASFTFAHKLLGRNNYTFREKTRKGI